MNRIINISVHLIVWIALYWRWNTANDELRTVLFYAVLITAAAQAAYLVYKNEKLEKKISDLQNAKKNSP